MKAKTWLAITALPIPIIGAAIGAGWWKPPWLSPDPDFVEIEQLAGQTLAGNWVNEGLDCSVAFTISVKKGSIYKNDTDASGSLLGRYKITGLSGSHFQADASGVQSEFWVDGVDLIYQTGTLSEHYKPCDRR